MALFGQAERATLPLLTQFYQVEVPTFERSKSEPAKGVPEYLEKLRGSELFTFLNETPSSEYFGTNPTPSQVRWYAQLHGAVVSYLNALADDTEVAAEVALFLQESFFRTLNPMYTVFREQRPDEGLPDQVRARSLRLYVHSPKAILVKELSELMQAPENKVQRCPECTSAYIVKRQGQVYCSDRCGVRVRQRRQYEREKMARISYAET